MALAGLPQPEQCTSAFSQRLDVVCLTSSALSCLPPLCLCHCFSFSVGDALDEDDLDAELACLDDELDVSAVTSRGKITRKIAC